MTKIISLKDKAYDRLKSLKEGKESFSDVVLKLTENAKAPSILAYAGTWKDTPEINEAMDKVIEERRKTK